eukprot:5433309-Prymnesium_polylepis.1
MAIEVKRIASRARGKRRSSGMGLSPESLSEFQVGAHGSASSARGTESEGVMNEQPAAASGSSTV